MTHANAASPEGRNFDAFSFLARFAPLIFLLVLMLVFAIIEPRFLSSINLFNVMRQVSITGLLAIGMTFVILTAGIDLSVGSLLAFAGLVAAAVAKGGMQDRFTVGDAAIGYGWPLALLAAIAVGIGGGYLQLPIFDANPLRTVNGSPIPREFVFVETNSAGGPQQAWRVPNDPALTDRTLGALTGSPRPPSRAR